MNTLPFDITPLLDLCKTYHVERLGVFGSIARGEADEDSDLDLLVRFSEPQSLLRLIALERKMAEILGRKVELVTEASLSPHIRPAVLNDLLVLYEAA